MNYGFVINNDTCIGCHACSTACKSENLVPLGVQRTWVKSVETGVYPNVSRSFQVTRCNHCANPPCVRICPVTAMYQRHDGIVEFDPDVCIGCKACMQACPYDAIYVDPDTGSVAKCHYCAHRVEVGLEPACVIVCPEHAILAGDLDDPTTEIAQKLASHKTTVRKPEQGTAPKLFYIGGNDAAMHPTATARTPEMFAWSDVIPLHGGGTHGGGAHGGGTHGAGLPGSGTHGAGSPSGGDGHSGSVLTVAGQGAGHASSAGKKSTSGTAIRTPGTQGLPASGPIMIGDGRMAEQMVQVTWNAQHKVPWHWPVPAYLVTKGIATGLFVLLAAGFLLGLFPYSAPAFIGGGLVSLFFTLATTALLVYDLEHPKRFLRIVLRPQWKSWLVRGAFLLIGFSTVLGLWWAAEAGAALGLLPVSLAESLRVPAFWVGIPLAVGAAIYTAFLFGQAEGRDLWQSSLLPVHLMVQATFAGAAALLMLDAVYPIDPDVLHLARLSFGIALAADVLVTLFGEVWMSHASESAAQAAHMITHGAYKRHFWIGSLGVGHALPLALLLLGSPVAAFAAGFCAIVGLYAYEYAFVMAPQEVPNS